MVRHQYTVQALFVKSFACLISPEREGGRQTAAALSAQANVWKRQITSDVVRNFGGSISTQGGLSKKLQGVLKRTVQWESRCISTEEKMDDQSRALSTGLIRCRLNLSQIFTAQKPGDLLIGHVYKGPFLTSTVQNVLRFDNLAICEHIYNGS